MTFTKNKLAAAMAGAFIAGVGSQAAYAVVNLDSTANAGVTVASETVFGTAGATLNDTAGGAFDVTGTMNVNAIPDSTDVRVSVALSGGTFAAPPALTLTAGTGAGGCYATTSTPTFAVFTGGGTADSSVTFNTNAGASDILGGCVMTFAPAGIVVTAQSALTVSYSVEIADNFGPTALGGKSGAYVKYGPVVALAADTTGAETTKNIDVAEDSKLFTSTANTTINVGGWRVADANGTAANPLSITGTAVTVGNIVGTARGTITAANGFGAFNQGTSVAGGAISCGGGTADAFSTADATIATCASYAVPAGGDAAGANAVVLTVDGGTANTVQIQETTLTATVAATGAATASFSAAGATGSVNLLSLSRNGSSARLSFALTPGGNYPMFIRLVNPSAVAGPVTLALTNDDGDTSASFDISTVAGGPAGDLVAGGSTGLLDISDVMAAAQAADPTFDLGATNKLRVNAVAEFGDNGNGTGVVMGAFSVSSDGTTFNMLTDASN